jgi:hypothetical protein
VDRAGGIPEVPPFVSHLERAAGNKDKDHIGDGRRFSRGKNGKEAQERHENGKYVFLHEYPS